MMRPAAQQARAAREAWDHAGEVLLCFAWFFLMVPVSLGSFLISAGRALGLSCAALLPRRRQLRSVRGEGGAHD